MTRYGGDHTCHMIHAPDGDFVSQDHFFFQAEDGMRDVAVTGVPCALPISLRQNQFGGAIGGPIQKDKTFLYTNYELQRRGESPFYNSAVLANIKFIDELKTQVYGLPAE